MRQFVCSRSACKTVDPLRSGRSTSLQAPALSGSISIRLAPHCASRGTSVLTADAGDSTVLDRTLGEHVFDVIIDDASHRSVDIISTFNACFSRLAPGGLYVIEDLHTSYWESYGGGFRKSGSALEWFKSLVDAAHFGYLDPAQQLDPETEQLLCRFNCEVARITFYNSIIVVERMLRPKSQPWRRIVAGAETQVQPDMKANVQSLDPMPEAESFFPLAAAALDGGR